MSGPEFRILALDGGGIRGAYSAAVLATIEEATGKRIVDHFDLIVGTSTGGIIALGLALGVPASDVLRFYQEHGPAIFPSRRKHQRVARWLRRWVAPKHDRAVLEAALSSVFKTRRLGEANCRLVIPAYNAATNDVLLFKTAHSHKYGLDYRRTAVEVALATAAAPTYFELSITGAGEHLIDGGVWANCPAVVGIVEALNMGIPVSQIQLLSVGTLVEARSFSAKAMSGGILGYRTGIVELFQDAQTRSALAQARLLLQDRYLRIDQHVQPKRFPMDDARRIGELIALGVASGQHRYGTVAEKFLAAPAVPFVPAHSVE
jgi:patatin-like phospholipase/acyl hydrolase